MLRRIVTAHQRPMLARRPLGSFERRCATSAAEKEAAPSATGRASEVATQKAESAAGGKASASSGGGGNTAERIVTSAHGPERKDWRTHKEVVWVKGVPAKGKLHLLPWSQQFVIYLVFSLAGMGAVVLVRPQIRYLAHHGFLGLTDDAGWKNGPWLYRLLYVLIMYPCYSALLFGVACVFGRRIWFSFMIHKMWSRLLTRKASDRLTHILDLQHY